MYHKNFKQWSSLVDFIKVKWISYKRLQNDFLTMETFHSIKKNSYKIPNINY